MATPWLQVFSIKTSIWHVFAYFSLTLEDYQKMRQICVKRQNVYMRKELLLYCYASAIKDRGLFLCILHLYNIYIQYAQECFNYLLKFYVCKTALSFK